MPNAICSIDRNRRSFEIHLFQSTFKRPFQLTVLPNTQSTDCGFLANRFVCVVTGNFYFCLSTFVARVCLSSLFKCRICRAHNDTRNTKQKKKKWAKWKSIEDKTRVWQLVCSTIYLFRFICNWEQNQLVQRTNELVFFSLVSLPKRTHSYILSSCKSTLASFNIQTNRKFFCAHIHIQYIF